MGLYNKKTYNFKSHSCDELSRFDIPFALKEYSQNVVGQILKILGTREWRDWVRTDLSNATQNERAKAKSKLFDQYPCIFAGEQGVALRKSDVCQPLYVLNAHIPKGRVTDLRYRRNHDFNSVIIFWKLGHGASALTFYNNYLDKEAKFSHFVHDGTSTSKGTCAVGHKGKGFILATSFLAQECQDFEIQCQDIAANRGITLATLYRDKEIIGMTGKPVGVGFNVGSRFCRTAFKGKLEVLKVTKEDLRPLSEREFRTENPKGKTRDVESDDEDDEDSPSDGQNTSFNYGQKLERAYKRRATLGLSRLRRPNGKGPEDEKAFVQEDDVCIHIIGLPKTLTAKESFSGVYGMFKEGKSERVDDVEFLIAEEQFFHRDQYLPISSPLAGLGINYHGELHLTSERMEIHRNGSSFRKYKSYLRTAMDKAICTKPELAPVIMSAMLVAESSEYKWTPGLPGHGGNYRAAFQVACRLTSPDICHNKDISKIFPFAAATEEEARPLINELGLVPYSLPDWKMAILTTAGAYTSIKEWSRELLLDAPNISTADFPGLDFLNHCVQRLIPEHSVSLRQNAYPRPRCVKSGKEFALARPEACKKCEGRGCVCWVGPALVRVMQTHRKDPDLDGIFRVYDEEKALLRLKLNPDPLITSGTAVGPKAGGTSTPTSRGSRFSPTPSRPRVTNTQALVNGNGSLFVDLPNGDLDDDGNDDNLPRQGSGSSSGVGALANGNRGANGDNMDVDAPTTGGKEIFDSFVDSDEDGVSDFMQNISNSTRIALIKPTKQSFHQTASSTLRNAESKFLRISKSSKSVLTDLIGIGKQLQEPKFLHAVEGLAEIIVLASSLTEMSLRAKGKAEDLGSQVQEDSAGEGGPRKRKRST